ncbi:MAG: hypothetical protein Q8P18_27705 [Pseudomonadota bacterium]|nr:hypothetical protein [Pseudomonadota bacterium]
MTTDRVGIAQQNEVNVIVYQREEHQRTACHPADDVQRLPPPPLLGEERVPRDGGKREVDRLHRVARLSTPCDLASAIVGIVG